MKILGVDFSGAKSDQNTWLTRGFLGEQGLILEDCRAVTRAELTRILAATSGPAVAALDFPFGVPESFAQYWQPEATTMPDLWAAAADMELADFIELRDRFVARWGEPKRLGDTFYPECYSCLHKANPNLVPMTFRGMQLLHQLGCADFQVPPLESTAGPAPIVLLEAMPGAALRALRLPYKGYKNGARAPQLRRQVWAGLGRQTFAPIANLEDFRRLALSNHDCLDSIVAAVTAVLWAQDPAVFRCPALVGSDDFDPVALLEGWLYAPSFLDHAGS
ncbi:MAG: DUF429 domain-containing protein [Dehalococcoidia bacterium]